MPYAAEISRTNPTCFVFLVDQSSSMLEPFGGQAGKRKDEGVAEAINRLHQYNSDQISMIRFLDFDPRISPGVR